MSADVLGWIASAVFLVRLVPQPIKLWRTGVPEGLSAMAALNGVISDVGWVLYGFSVALVPVWAVSVASLVPTVATAGLLLVTTRKVSRPDLIGSAIWLLSVAVAWKLGTLVTVLGLSVVVNHGPQVVAAVRERDLRGISASTYLIALADAGLWGTYGLAVSDPALIAYGVVLLTAALIILGRIWWTQRGGEVALAYSS
ncbi:MAG: PQ-loop domain-containing transporter [Acidimicrobiales bacterium]|nr:PQ-loop domain-containing transporter [Acidimicrobiales bacterium]